MQRGFSLVELSIVLVILGLLTGGILAGQSLIRASELRAVSTEFQRYVTAAHTFRDKYFALPGDFTKATDFWQPAHPVAATCLTTQGTGTQTCNGDGNGLVEWSQAGRENYIYWEHLANAGLIEGSYTGIANSGAEAAGINIPRSRANNAGYVAFNGTTTGSALYGLRGNMYMLAKPIPSGVYEGGLLKAEEAWNIDSKLDDGLADRGKFVAAYGNSETGCITGTLWVVGAAYDLANQTPSCRLVHEF